MKPDASDIVGGLGVALVAAGLGATWGWPWASMFVGGCLLALYVLHEIPRGRKG